MPAAAARRLLCAFVTLLSAAAVADNAWLVSRSITLGGAPGSAFITDTVVAPGGDILVAGTVTRQAFPGIASSRAVNGGYARRFVARFDPVTGAQRFAVVVGAFAPVIPNDLRGFVEMDGGVQGMAVDAMGAALVAAYDTRDDFPATGGTFDARIGQRYLYRVDAQGAVTRFAQPLDPSILRLGGLAFDRAGSIYLAGTAGSGLATTAGAPFGAVAVASGCIAPFVIRLDAAGRTLFSTYLGYAGTQGEACGRFPSPYAAGAHALALDGAGNVYVTGQAEPGVRATPGAVSTGALVPPPVPGKAAVSHAFVAKLDNTGALRWLARLGGTYRERGTAVGTDAAGNVYVAGLTTSSSDFPWAGTALPRISIGMNCLLWTNEIGFVARLAPDGSRIDWAGGLPLDGSEIDDCGTSSTYVPVLLAFDAAGNLLLTGRASSNRMIDVSRNALQLAVGDAFFMQISPAGALLHATWLDLRAGPRALAVDPAGEVHVAGGSFLQTLSPGRTPVTLTVGKSPGCAGQSTALEIRVAGAPDGGDVNVSVDGASIGALPVRGRLAARSLDLTAGVHRIDAVYHGPGPSDGYAAPTILLPVNQAGACP